MTDIIVTTLADELDLGASVNAPGGDGLSLREALSLASDGDRVLFVDHISKLERDMVIRKFTKIAKQSGKSFIG